jgi:hypothetical protein
MKLKSIIGSLLAAAGLLAANPSSAETVNLFGLNSNLGGGLFQYDDDVLRGSVTCTSCDGALSDQADGSIGAAPLPNVNTMQPAVWSDTTADLFSLANSAEQTEIDAVNFITGSSFTLADFTKFQNDPSFNTDALYILIKIGVDPNYALIKNTDGAQDFLYAQIGQGAGLSHVSLFGGTTTTVSEPGILGLFGVGLVLLGFLRRRTIV